MHYTKWEPLVQTEDPTNGDGGNQKGTAAERDCNDNTRVYRKVPGLAAWSENCKWYSSLPLSAVVSLFCESV
jgi:hypothetical protein